MTPPGASFDWHIAIASRVARQVDRDGVRGIGIDDDEIGRSIRLAPERQSGVSQHDRHIGGAYREERKAPGLIQRKFKVKVQSVK